MKTSETRIRRLTWASLAGTLAVLVVVGLSLLLSRFHALAQPVVEVAALTVEKTANTNVAEPGDRLIYTIRIHETGPQVTLWMTDSLPEEVTYVDDSLQFFGPGSAGFAGGVITWTSSNFGYGTSAIITFSAQISPETTVTQIENTAQVTGTGQLVMDSANTTVLSGALPVSQIRSPDMDAIIAQKEPLPISGIAWLSGIVPPYLVDTPVLSVQRMTDRRYYVTWTEVVLAGNYILQEARKPDFSDKTETVVAAPTTNQLISKEGAGQDGTYYYRVQAFRLDLNPSRWSNVKSVVVPWTVASTSLSVPALPTDLAANSPITVQVRIDSGEWHTAIVTSTTWGGWDWVYNWSLPQEDDVQHTIQSQASDAGGNLGPIDSITVTLRNRNYIMYMPLLFKRWPPICYAPTLNAITDPEGDGAYTVSWSYAFAYPQPITYTLQEATDANFTVGVYYYNTTTNNTSQPISGKAINTTYYYRVRGNNEYGAGEWSNVQSVTVIPPYYFDDFSNPGSGWPRVSKKVIADPEARYRLNYENGQYRIRIDPGGPDIWFHQPDALAPYWLPSDKYCVETQAKLEKGKDPYQEWNYYPYWANGGLVFGATEDNKRIYAICLSTDSVGLGWFITSNPVYEYPYKGCAYQGGSAGGGPVGGEDAGSLAINNWHRIQVGVDGNHASVYIDGVYKGTWGMSGLSATTWVGLIGGDYEVTPVDFRFDNFKVTPNAACTP